MPVKDFGARIGHPKNDPESLALWLDKIPPQFNTDGLNPVVPASGDKLRIFDVSASLHGSVTLAALGAALTFSSLTVTGLVDISASGAGQIKFPATQNPSANANTLDDYEEGTWTPIDSSGAALTLTSAVGIYQKVGNHCVVTAAFTYPITADISNNLIGGLPFSSSSNPSGGIIVFTSVAAALRFFKSSSSTVGTFLNSTAVQTTNAQMSASGNQVQATYQTS